jgi:hypothetical protein
LRAAKIVNCHQTVVQLSLQSAMTAIRVAAQIFFARIFARADASEVYLLGFLLADGYPIKMIKRTHLR